MSVQRSTARVKRGMCAAVSVSLAFALAGCSTGAAQKNASSTDSQTIVVQQQAGENNIKAIDVAVKLFEAAHPNIKVKVQVVTQEAKGGSNLAVITGPNAPDVALVAQNSTVYTAALSAKKLIPLDDVWKQANLAEGYGDLGAAFTAPDGHPYLVSIDRVYYNVVYVNLDMFEKAGITMPENHRIASAADLYAIVDKLKKYGKQGLAIGGASGYQATWMLDGLLPTRATPDQIKNYLTNYQAEVPQTAKFTDAAFVDTLTTLSDYAKNGVYQQGFLANKGGPASEALFTGQRTGMLLDGSFSAAILRESAKFKMGWLLLPPINPSQPTQLSAYAGDAMAIPTGSKHQAAAKLFLESLFTQTAQQKVTVEAQGALPAIDGLPASVTSSADPLVQEQIADVAANGSQSGWTSTVPANVGQAFTDPLVQAMYAGQKTPAAIGEAVQGAVEKNRAAK